jgi:hypothetical protein
MYRQRPTATGAERPPGFNAASPFRSAALAAPLSVGSSFGSLRAHCGCGKLKDRSLLPFHQVSQQHDLTIRKFQGIVMRVRAV